MSRFRAVCFDLDGTLLDTLEDLADSMNAALSHSGWPIHDVSAYRQMVGDGIQILASRAVPSEARREDILEQVVKRMREEYSQRWSGKSKPYPGIPELLDGLKERALPMAVLTNKPHDFALLCVQKLLPNWSFQVIQGVTEDVFPKPDPSGALGVARNLAVLPEDILYLGDTDTDMRTAIAAGMWPVGVTWGFRSADELRHHGARVLLDRPQQLLDLC